LERAKDLGVSIISIPRGTIAMRQGIREDVIKRSIHRGFKVITILGRRHPEEELSWSLVLQLISDDLKLGVFKVLIRAERNSSGFGICDSRGYIKKSQVLHFLDGVDHPDKLVWEAACRIHQQDLIYHLGLNVNLGGIEPGQALSLEGLRQGLVGEKERKAYLERKYWRDLQKL
jgi:phosphosulfolactate synthase